MQLRGIVAAFLTMFCGVESCGGSRKIGPTGILIATAGSSPFSDAVWVLSEDGNVAKRVLTPSRSESYPYASGRSMNGPFVIGVHKSTVNVISDSLAIFSAAFTDPRPLAGCDTQFASQAYGVFDSSSKRLVFSGKSADQAGIVLWVCDTDSGKLQRITVSNESRSWDSYPVWAPDGQHVLYLRITQSGSSLESKLWSVPLDGGAASMVTSGPIAAFCVSRDGGSVGAVTAYGIDVFAWPSFTLRRHLVPWQSLRDFTYSGGGIAFADDPPRIVIPLSQGELTHVLSVNVATGEVKDLRQMTGRATSIAWLSMQ